MRALVLLAVLLIGCGGNGIDPFGDAKVHDAALETETAPDASVEACTPGQRFRDDCTIEYGCCVGATPACQSGQCIEWDHVDAQPDQ